MKFFIRAKILSLSILFVTQVVYAADSSSNRKDNILSFGIRAGAGWPAVTTPFFIAVPGVFEDWNFGLEYGSKTYTSDSTSSGIKFTFTTSFK